MRIVALAAVAAAAIVAVVGTAASGSGPVTVYAAASLTDVLPRIEPEARYSFAGSNQLALQIREGAPADVFTSASPELMWALHRAGLVERPVVFADNTLVLVVPARNPAGIRALRDVARPGVRLVVAGPAVPVGAYTRKVLRRLGLSAALANVVSQEPDVRGVLGKVALGEADAGLVYRTDARAAGARVRTLPVPAEAQPGVRYELAIVRASRNREAARAFVGRVTGPSGRGQLSRAGFLLPER